MLLTRNFTNKIHFLFDQCLPPLVRDSGLFRLIFKILFRHNSDSFLNFKKNVLVFTEDEFIQAYKDAETNSIDRPTDLNVECWNKIFEDTIGPRVLEVGCGSAVMSEELSKRFKVVACDIHISKAIRNKSTQIDFVETNAENLPFKDNEFDTVICTHVLEHVRDLKRVISELRRVCKSRLVIVVPMQRPYRYTFDFHIHFFPYPESLLLQLWPITVEYKIATLGGDLYYCESKSVG